MVLYNPIFSVRFHPSYYPLLKWKLDILPGQKEKARLYMYKGSSESNVSYFITLAHSIRGWCLWYDSRGCTFPPVFHYILLPHDRWQQRGTLTQECGWSRGIIWISPCRNKWHPLTFIDTCWTFVEIKQWMWAQWGAGWCVSAVVTSGSPPLVQIVVSAARRLSFTTDKNAELIAVTMLKKEYFVAEILLYQTVLLCSLYHCSFRGNK